LRCHLLPISKPDDERGDEKIQNYPSKMCGMWDIRPGRTFLNIPLRL